MYCLLKPDAANNSRLVVTRADGDEMLLGQVDLSCYVPVSLGVINALLKTILRKERTGELTEIRTAKKKVNESKCESKALDTQPSFGIDDVAFQTSLMRLMKRVAHTAVEEITSDGLSHELAKLAEYGMTAWIDAGMETYFELSIQGFQSQHFKGVNLETIELVVITAFMKDVEVTLCYWSGAFFLMLAEAGARENSLMKSQFPSLSNRGVGVQLRSYGPDSLYSKLSIWRVSSVSSSVLAALTSKASMTDAKKPKDKDSVQFETGQTKLDDDELLREAEDSFKGSYTQTYLVSTREADEEHLAGEADGLQRRALFRYGNWCYEGSVQLEDEMELAKVPFLLRSFQRQQASLKFVFETKNIPLNHEFQTPLTSLLLVSSVIKKYMLESEPVLRKLDAAQRQRGLGPWVDSETGKQYFELQVSHSFLRDTLDGVDFLATKIYYQEVVFIVLYFRSCGSFFVTLNPTRGDQPLLDMSFPDVSTKNRGYLLFTFQHHSFKKFLLWECQKSVWEASNKMVLKQHEQQSSEQKKEKKEVEIDTDATTKACKVLDQQGKRNSDRSPSQKKPVTVEDEELTRTSRLGEESKVGSSALEQGKTAHHIRAPHHIKPLGKQMQKKSLYSLPSLESEVPWDQYGRPKSLFPSSGEAKHSG